MTFKEQLIEFLASKDDNYGAIAEALMNEELYEVDTPYDFSIDFVDSYGGEDMGSEYWTVYKFTKDGEELYVKFSGWYQSYSGAEYEGFSFVQPKEKMVTYYE